MAKRKLKRILKQEKQWAAGSRQKRKAYVKHLADLRILLKETSKKVKIKLIRSLIGTSPVQKRTAQVLGLNKISSYSVRELTPTVRGMVNNILHLIDIQEVD